MKVVKFFLFCFFFFSYSHTHSHNPEDFMIAEIERGQMYFEKVAIPFATFRKPPTTEA